MNRRSFLRALGGVAALALPGRRVASLLLAPGAAQPALAVAAAKVSLFIRERVHVPLYDTVIRRVGPVPLARNLTQRQLRKRLKKAWHDGRALRAMRNHAHHRRA